MMMTPNGSEQEGKKEGGAIAAKFSFLSSLPMYGYGKQ